MGILGCFQKLLSSPSTEADAFNLLAALVLYVPLASMKQHNATVFQLLLTKLQSTKSSKAEHRYLKFAKLVIHFFALFVAKFGPNEFFAELAGIQQGIAISLIAQVWLPKIQTDPPRGLDSKIQVLGLTKLLCETPSLFDDPAGQQLWCGVLLSLSTMLSAPAAAVDGEADLESLFEIDVQYDSAYSGLSFAKKQVVDPFPEVAEPVTAFAMALQSLSNQRPGQLAPLVHESLKSDPKLAHGMDALLQKSGVRLA